MAGARTLNKLTDMVARKLKEPGWYGDGAGLYLRVQPDGKRWVFVFQWKDPGSTKAKRKEMGLGSYPEVGLAEARDGPFGRTWAREQVRAGRNPVDERKRLNAEAATPPAAVITFGTWASEIGPAIGPKATKALKKWIKSVTDDAPALASRPLSEVQTEDVLGALKPYWNSRPTTAQRMRQRIERVLDAGRARGHIAAPVWANPARWKGHLENLLKKPAIKVQHHKALPYVQAPSFFADLRERTAPSALALRFTIVTVARTKETIFARKSEIDREAKLWIVPAERMKGLEHLRREHRVPLVAEALEIIEAAWELPQPKGSDWLFPSQTRPGKAMSTAAMERVLDDMGLEGIATVHGMRSMFKDWASDCTNFPNEVSEAALAHVIGDETERAYRRTDALEKRRKLMETWEAYLRTPPAAGNVLPLSRPA